MADALAWEASYQVWCRRCGHGDQRNYRDIWANASLWVRVRQAERWLRLERRPRRRAAEEAGG